MFWACVDVCGMYDKQRGDPTPPCQHLESFTLDSTVFVQHSPEEAGRGQLVSLVGGHNHQNVSPDGQQIGQQDHQERGETVRHALVCSHQNVLKSKFPQLK